MENTMSAQILPFARPVQGKAATGPSVMTEKECASDEADEAYLSTNTDCTKNDPADLREKLQRQFRTLIPPKVAMRVERESASIDMAYMLGAALSEMRCKRGMTFAEVALVSGISLQTMMSIEVGGGVLGARMDTINRYLSALMARISFTLEFKEEKLSFEMGSGLSAASSELLLLIRQMSGLSQKSIELAGGWKGGFISRLEKNDAGKSVSATLSTVTKIANTCRVNISLASIAIEPTGDLDGNLR